MKWSQAKKKFESSLASCVQNRLRVHITKYRETSNLELGKGWITLDGKEVVSVMIPSFYSSNFSFRTNTMNFGEAIKSYINMNINEIKESKDELINSFMFLDKRIGKRSMQNINSDSLHPFSQVIYKVRYELDTFFSY
jgi:hypothetical protein